MGRDRIVTPWEYTDAWTEINRATERARSDLAETDESVSHLLSAESIDDVDWAEIIEPTREAEEMVVIAEEIADDLLSGTVTGTRPSDESAIVVIDELKETAESVTEARELLERAQESAAQGATEAVKRDITTATEAIEQGRKGAKAVSNAATEARQPERPIERDWVDMIKNTIPVEVLGVWAFVAALVTASPGFNNDWYWWIFAAMVVATTLHAFQDILESDRTGKTVGPGQVVSPAGGVADSENDDPVDPAVEALQIKRRTIARRWSAVVQVILAVVAFAVWVYYLGGPFLESGLHDPTIAAIALPLTVVFGPQLFDIYVYVPTAIELRLRS